MLGVGFLHFTTARGCSSGFSLSVVGKKAQGNTNSPNFSLPHTHTLILHLLARFPWLEPLPGWFPAAEVTENSNKKQGEGDSKL